jgi:cell division protein FtsW (lipid II flippase)
MIEMVENNFILLLLVLAIFSINAIFRQNFRSFQMNIIIFILIMIFGEVVINFSDINDSNNRNNAMELEVQIQFVALVFLLTVVWFRYYKILKSRRKLVETIESILK